MGGGEKACKGVLRPISTSGRRGESLILRLRLLGKREADLLYTLLMTLLKRFGYPLCLLETTKMENASLRVHAFLGEHILVVSGRRLSPRNRPYINISRHKIREFTKNSSKVVLPRIGAPSVLPPYDCYYTIYIRYSQYKKYSFNRCCYRLFLDKQKRDSDDLIGYPGLFLCFPALDRIVSCRR